MRTRPLTPWLVLLAAMPAALVATASGRGPLRRADFPAEVSPVIYPAQELPLRFSHALHLGRAKMACTDCHTAAPESRSSLDLLIPGEDRCRPCHAIDRAQPDPVLPAGAPPARCVACHPGWTAASGRQVARVRIPTPNLKFDHKAHRLRGTTCVECHGDYRAEGVTLATRAQLPPEPLCLTCHDGRRAAAECTTCHLAAGGGRMITGFAAGELVPSASRRGDAHGLTFATDHRAAAENNQGSCQSCHSKQDCLDCHAGVLKPLSFHGNDYLATHSIDARHATTDCSTCHRQQTFCVGCHSRAGVAADGRGSEFVPPSIAPAGRRFHPPGWVEFDGDEPLTGDDTRGEDHHSFEAQRNIAQCASCHRESFCLTCHSAQPTSFGINPHPNDWRGSRRCESLRRKNGRMCLRCHTEDLAVPSCD